MQRTNGIGPTTTFPHDDDALIMEYSSTGSILRRYVHGLGVDDPIVWYEGSSVGASARRFLHADKRGSITAITDNSGATISVNTHDY